MSIKGNKTLDKEINKIELLTPSEITNLFIEYSNLNDSERKREIENHIAYHNIRLIRDFILKKYNIFKKTGYEYEELISIGYIGLLDAIRKFDYTKGYQFSTYAVYYIKKELYENVYTFRPVIQVKKAGIDRMIKYKQFVSNYFQNHGKYPSDEEIMQALNITILALRNVKLYIKLLETFSIDEYLNADNAKEDAKVKLIDIITYEEELFEDSVIYEIDKENKRGYDFDSILHNSDLTEKEKRIIKLRVLKGLSYEEIGKIEKVSRETVRKRYLNGKNKLRVNSDIMELKKYGK